jgi:hypothetical protein
LPNGPSSHALGISWALQTLLPCGPRYAPPVAAASPEAGVWLAATSAA